MEILSWNIYQITANETLIKGVMLRGKLRKLALEKNTNLLVENASDLENCVRFALLSENEPSLFMKYINSVIPDSKITLVSENVKNPVLSKLKVNLESRYTP